MPNTLQLNQGQRQAFEKTLYESLRKAEREHEKKDDEARAIALQKIIEQTGGAELAKQANEYTLKLEETKLALEALGFRIRNSQLELDYDGPRNSRMLSRRRSTSSPRPSVRRSRRLRRRLIKRGQSPRSMKLRRSLQPSPSSVT
jgi:hypothetical protein